MKFCRDEMLLLGGMYQVAALIVSLLTFDISGVLNGILYILFWLAVLAIAFNWVPKFVFKMNDAFPRVSVFLASIGWIPYFAVLYALLTVGVDFMVSGSNSVTLFLSNYMPVYEVYLAAVLLSLVYAAYKVFYKEENLAMACRPVIGSRY